jgi:hypothetical protein
VGEELGSVVVTHPQPLPSTILSRGGHVLTQQQIDMAITWWKQVRWQFHARLPLIVVPTDDTLLLASKMQDCIIKLREQIDALVGSGSALEACELWGLVISYNDLVRDPIKTEIDYALIIGEASTETIDVVKGFARRVWCSDVSIKHDPWPPTETLVGRALVVGPLPR